MSLQQSFVRWGLDDVLRRHKGISISMDDHAPLVLAGTLSFTAAAPGLEAIADSYDIEIAVPENFPRGYPRVRELGDRIDKRYHRLTDGSFCLGSPARVRLLISEAKTLAGFIEKCVIPYLYGYSYCLKHGHPPFGELAHGDRGIIDDYQRLLGVDSVERCAEMLFLIGQKLRVANKQPCACGSGRRLGCCHHRTANRLRNQLGRGWCRREAAWLVDECVDPALLTDRRRLLAQTSVLRSKRKELERTLPAAPVSSEIAIEEKAVA
jgi:hypothetical protein